MGSKIESKFLPFCDNEFANREDNAANCAEEAIKLAVEFKEYVEGLSPRDRVSVWSKDGQGSGLFNLDSEQLMAKFLRVKYS